MEENLSSTPPEIRKIAEEASNQLLPPKSSHLYMKAYEIFKKWCSDNNTNRASENVLMAYFQNYAKNKKASTLWAHYSMLRSTISLKENIDIAKYFKLHAFLKRQNLNYHPKKSLVFNQDDITKFLTEAPDVTHIVAKAILVIGVAGACRSDELTNLLLSDLNIKDDLIVINIRNSKNGSSRKFVVMETLWIQIIKKYLKMKETVNMPKLFTSIKNGHAIKQNIGHNTIGQMPKQIAAFLKLENPELYTGHSFRRSSATILASNGGNILQLKQHGGWKSSTVAEGYIEDSLPIKKSIACMVQGPSSSSACTASTNTFDVPLSSLPRKPYSAEIPSTSKGFEAIESVSPEFTNTKRMDNVHIPSNIGSEQQQIIKCIWTHNKHDMSQLCHQL